MNTYKIILLAIIITIISNQNLKVTTTKGDIQGLYDSNLNCSYFLGIPYAQPPINSLRWKPPKPIEKWSHPLSRQLLMDLNVTNYLRLVVLLRINLKTVFN